MVLQGVTTTQGPLSTNPFVAAGTVSLATQNFVENQFDWAREWATTELNTAVQLISNIANFPNTIELLPPGTVPLPVLDLSPDWNTIDLGTVPTSTFGVIDSFPDLEGITVDGLPSISPVTIPGFSPSITGLAIPPAPDPTYIPTPDVPPEEPVFSFPTAPTVVLPDFPVLSNVNVPTFVAPVLPEFFATFPEFQEQDINTLMNWSEPVYTREIIDSVIVQINTFLAGGSGINPNVEEAIYARGHDRESRAVRQQVQQAMEEWAGKGYTAPPGMLVQRVDSIREEGLIKALGLNRDIVIKVHDTEIENLRFAVQQGIAAEQLFVQMFLAAVERLFEVQKLYVQWQIDLYNIAVTIFNAKMQEVEIRVRVYEAQIRTKLAEIEVFKAQIDAARATAEVNKVLVEAYTARIQANIAIVQMYSEQVKAVGIRADVYATQIQAYKGTVEAYAAQVGADKLRFDAYDSRVRGELGKASIVESESRAYAAEIEGIGTGVRAEVAALEGEVSKIQVQVQAFMANVQAASEKGRIQLAQLQGNVAGHEANVRRFMAEAAEEEAKAKVDLAGWESKNRVALAFFDAQIKEFEINQQSIIEQAKLSLQSLTSAAEISSTIGAGALAAMHVGASLSSGASIGASGSDSVSFGNTWSTSYGIGSTSSLTVDDPADFVVLASPF